MSFAAGKLVLTDRPNVTVTRFTQAQVNHHKIAYQPPDTELGIIARAMQFTFSVSDNAGNVLPDQVGVRCCPVECCDLAREQSAS